MPDLQRRVREDAGRPRVVVDVALDGVRVGVSRADLAEAAGLVLRAEGVRDAMVSIALVSPRAIARLNRKHLGHTGPTDVISFALTHPGNGGPLVADVYVCPAVARANARAWRSTARAELLRLVVHGTLHATGWDHPEGDARMTSPMWKRQERLLARIENRRRDAKRRRRRVA